jgi:alanine dehydrogenase
MILLSAEDLAAVLDPAAAEAAVADALRQEAAGRARLPERLTVDLDGGWFRLMPGALDGLYGVKVMNLARGHGIYYQLLLFDAPTGEPLALMDASVLTQVRTGATGAVCVRSVFPGGVDVAGLFGTGFEARGQLRALAGLVRRFRVYSPNPAHREAFAAEMGAAVPVEAVCDPREAAAGLPLVVLATRSAEPVLRGEWLDPGSVVVSLGSTRPDLREVDVETVRRARPTVVDHRRQALRESGDLIAAGLTAAGLVELHRFVSEPARPESEVLLFKPLGTALQDLAVAGVAYGRCRAAGLGRAAGALLTRKDR